MLFHEALAVVLKQHEITASAIAEMADMKPSQVSHFISGRRGVHYQNLNALIAALPEPAYMDLFWLMAGIRPGVISSVEDALATLEAVQLTDEQIAALLTIASNQLRSASPAPPKQAIKT